MLLGVNHSECSSPKPAQCYGSVMSEARSITLDRITEFGTVSGQ